eukprot:TRINITY_DN4828_c0_g1_i2.p1 TRINITY_DN4828_c0_g1~~TRINITY_DN4828_c0_g1_i2.p1  ORF type:complete len:477 (-),score=23.64 TRINITY_DN4828_c0_g1_i2:356-1786(-)
MKIESLILFYLLATTSVSSLNCYSPNRSSERTCQPSEICLSYRLNCSQFPCFDEIENKYQLMQEVYLCVPNGTCSQLISSVHLDYQCCDTDLCNTFPTPSVCSLRSTSPVNCSSTLPGTDACTELITCGNVRAGTCPNVTTSSVCDAFGNSYCCPSSGYLPYFVDGVCQCVPDKKPAECKGYTSSPVPCDLTVINGSCLEAITCSYGSACANETSCTVGFALTTCCPGTSVAPYFVNGYCQCPQPLNQCKSRSPVPCAGYLGNSSACIELATCSVGSTGQCNTSSCSIGGLEFCCRIGEPYLIDGVCQCSSSSTPVPLPTPTPIAPMPTPTTINPLPTNTECKNLNYNPRRTCISKFANTDACLELVTCGNVRQGTCNSSQISASCDAYGNSYCCPTGFVPYFVDGVCQCPSDCRSDGDCGHNQYCEPTIKECLVRSSLGGLCSMFHECIHPFKCYVKENEVMGSCGTVSSNSSLS